ncbi:Ig-like domain repeat protein, partial [archaeon]|nr:Ig-like domain repeat protein [archaeon]
MTFTAVVSTSGGAPAGKVIFYEIVMETFNTTQINLGEDTTAVSLGGDSYEYTFSTSTLATGDHIIIASYEKIDGTSSQISDVLAQKVVEQTWPTVTITSAPLATSFSRQATFEFSSDTEGTAFECSLSEGYISSFDDLTWSACSSPQTYTDLTYGLNYTFAVKVQGAPLTATTLAWHLWSIAVPQVTITGGPEIFTESTDATLTFSSDPAGVDLVCYLIKQESGTQNTVILEDWVPCTSPHSLTGLSRGYDYLFEVKPEGAADFYGAARQWSITRISLTSSPNPSEFGSAVTFTATLWDDSGTEPGGTVSFAEMVYMWPGGEIPQFLDQGSAPTASGTGSFAYTFSTSGLAIGSHNIIALYTVTDEEGNIKTITSLPITQEVTEVTTQAPAITSQPANYTVCAGSSVSLTAAASGMPVPTVQWQVSNDGGTTWTNISGATTATYTFSTVVSDNGKRYRAVFTNSAGSATTSSAILTVNTTPAVTTQPTNLTVTYSENASFTVEGTNYTSVQWQVNPGTGWSNISGATSETFELTKPDVSLNGNQYRAVFTNTCGIATSSAATLTVNKAAVTATAGNYNGTYDGSAHSPSACVVTGAFTGDLNCTNTPSSVGPNVGSGIISPSVSGTGLTNYTITEVNGDWSITPAVPTCSINGYTGVYDGDPHGANGTCTGIGGTDLSADLDLGDSFTNVPGGTANWNFTNTSGNYTNDSGSVEISISKATPTCSISGYNDIYDGDPHGASGTCTGVNDTDLSVDLNLGTSFTNVSGGTANWSFTDTSGNYTNDSGSVEISISKATPTCSINGYTGVYDGDPHGASGTCTGVNDTDL